MDPNAALARIIEAEDGETFRGACSDLAAWLRGGGFRPSSIPAGARFMPGYGTEWSLLSPHSDTGGMWALARYDGQGKRLALYPLL